MNIYYRSVCLSAHEFCVSKIINISSSFMNAYILHGCVMSKIENTKKCLFYFVTNLVHMGTLCNAVSGSGER